MATIERTYTPVFPEWQSGFGVGSFNWGLGSATITGVRAKLSTGTGTFNLGIGGSRSGGWDKTKLADEDILETFGGVIWHLRADDLVEGTGASDGDEVEWWYPYGGVDGAVNRFTTFRSSTATEKPLIKTALGPGDDDPTVLFDGTNDRMPVRDGTNVMAAEGSFTMFFVIGDLSSTSTAPLVGTWDTSAGSREALWGTVSSRQFWQNDDGEYKRTSADVAADQIRSMTFNGPDGESTEHIDGAATFTADGSVSKDFPFTWDTIGASAYTSSSDYFDGGISEVILFDSNLSDDERELVEGYLAHKYFPGEVSTIGIINPLAAGHPYKVDVPWNPVYTLSGNEDLSSSYPGSVWTIPDSGKAVIDGTGITFYIPNAQLDGEATLTVELTYS